MQAFEKTVYVDQCIIYLCKNCFSSPYSLLSLTDVRWLANLRLVIFLFLKSCRGLHAMMLCPFHWLRDVPVFLSAGSGEGCGKIIQRFPKKDWEGTAFPQGVEMVSDNSLLKTQINQTEQSSAPTWVFEVLYPEWNTGTQRCTKMSGGMLPQKNILYIIDEMHQCGAVWEQN